MKYSREDLLEFFGKFFNKNGRLPTRREARANGITEDPFVRVFGSYSGAKEVYLETLQQEIDETKQARKDFFISIFRENVVRVMRVDNNGNMETYNLTLSKKYLSDYKGKGTSKKADSNTVFLYDIDEKRFRKILISEIQHYSFKLDN